MLKDIAYLGRNTNVRTEGKQPMMLADLEADPVKHKAATRKGGLAKKAQMAQARRYGGFTWNAGCEEIFKETERECRDAGL